ncbi:hypothetical protein ACS0TY_012436 [Phlomoides rotata]
MLFYLTTLHLVRFLREDPLVVDKSDTDNARRAAYDQLGKGYFLYRNYILGGLVDLLYNVYHKVLQGYSSDKESILSPTGHRLHASHCRYHFYRPPRVLPEEPHQVQIEQHILLSSLKVTIRELLGFLAMDHERSRVRRKEGRSHHLGSRSLTNFCYRGSR